MTEFNTRTIMQSPTKQLSNIIFYSKPLGEVSMATAGKRARGGELLRTLVLKHAVRTRKITQHQANWVEEVWGNTIGQRTGQWSVSAARTMSAHTANQRKPIFAEARSNGKGHTGRIYFDCDSEDDIETLAQVVFESTSIFQSFGKGKKKVAPLVFEKDKQIIKAIVYGLFMRPRMAGYIKTDIEDGLTIEPAPRCISENALRTIRLLQVRKQEEAGKRRDDARKRQRTQARFMRWASAFVQHANKQREFDAQLANMAEVDDWETLCDDDDDETPAVAVLPEVTVETPKAEYDADESDNDSGDDDDDDEFSEVDE
jgi:hypothetical protein